VAVMTVTDAGRTSSSTLVVGHGLIGRAVRKRLNRVPGISAISVARRPRNIAGYVALELSSESGRVELERVIADLSPDCAVLVHGPSDVSWTEGNEAAAAATHSGVADVVARSGVPAILVSTDNVFPGNHGRYGPHDAVDPANAYGRVKAQAETILLAARSAMVLRVSLVYGWAPRGQRPTFAQRCLEAAVTGGPMYAPIDQLFTPIHVRDASAVIAGLCRSANLCTGVEHLAGPVELSRYDFARAAYRLAGADPAQVKACRRQDSEWACRPAFSSLTSGDFTHLPGLATWHPMTPERGLLEMLDRLNGTR
jgi:dTDP-4-dehydrorhamnose reductase